MHVMILRQAAPLMAALATVLATQGCAPAAPPAEEASASAGDAAAPAPSDAPYIVAATDSAAGAYVAVIGGCNDCHTVGWDQNDGNTPDADRLKGNPVGYRGPWGTTYAANLRMHAGEVTEDTWVEMLTTAHDGKGRPPMPWMNTRQMSEHDLRNLYRYIRALGESGEATPRSVAPDAEPTTPFILMVPQQPGSGD